MKALYYKLRYLFLNTYRNIKRVFQYLPIIWKDRDWDYEYLLTLMRYKLTRMRKEIANGYGDEGEWKNPRTKEIDDAIKMIDTVVAGKFAEDLWEKHNKKYGRLKSFNSMTEDGKRMYNIYFEKVGPKNKKKNDKAKKELSIISKEEDRQCDEAYKNLFEHLNKYIRGWWD